MTDASEWHFRLEWKTRRPANGMHDMWSAEASDFVGDNIIIYVFFN